MDGASRSPYSVDAVHADGAAEAALLAEFRRGLRAGLFGSGMGGHVIAGYERVLKEGFLALAEAARAQPRSDPFALSSYLVCTAASDYTLRYAAQAEEMAQATADPTHQRHLARIAEACRWVAFHPARTFFEAVQLLWLTHEIIVCEQPSGSLSLGRLDQILYPFYARDLAGGQTAGQAAGTLTAAEAQELIEALWIKLGGLKRAFQNVVLGGCGPDGRYAANDISFFCLQATRKLRMDQPLLSVRWHPSIPDDFWQEVQGLIQIGTGFPALFNDEVAIAAKGRLGVAPEDAANYAIVGCVELSIPGREFSQTEGLRVNWAKVLDLMLNDGTCSVTGTKMSLKGRHNLAMVGSFDDFLCWYEEELEHFVDLGIRAMNLLDRAFPDCWPYPFLSSTMDGCLAAGRDVTAGSTTYNLSSVNGCGMANVADSLVAIKQAVFDRQRISLPQLAVALRHDFAGAENLREELRSRSPKYGNDHDEPDLILKRLADRFCQQVAGYSNPRGGRFQAGLYTVDAHVHLGKLTGALPDGRHRGLALASALSPTQGLDRSGPTAAIKSATKLDHRLLGNGMVLDLKFHPGFFADAQSQRSFRYLVETYFRLGGMEIQFNVISRETLLAAQKTPEEYRHLLVRVSGFSAYFVDLDRVCQDEIIARTEHMTL
jgi:formate C-acetyltransferase